MQSPSKISVLIFLACIISLAVADNIINLTSYKNRTNKQYAAVLNLTILRINDSCEVKIIKSERVMDPTNDPNATVPVSIYQDPCNLPRLRSFMNCNPKTKKCECYRDWGEDGIPNYDDVEGFQKKDMWFKYVKESDECMVMEKKKCGLRGLLATPYRCIKGRCVSLSEVKDITYVCSGCGRGWRTRSFGLSIVLILMLSVMKLLTTLIT